jgi:Tfp pilus assembly protein PilX
MMRPYFDERDRDDRGIALIIALFALLLISSVGAAILFMSAGESSIVSNQRAYTTGWEAAKGGLEEARDRISSGDPNKFGANLPTDASHILYVINPASVSDTVDPAVSTNAYFDSEYNTEWGQPITSVGLTVTKVNSDMQTLLSGSILTSIPSFKWVRLTGQDRKERPTGR